MSEGSSEPVDDGVEDGVEDGIRGAVREGVRAEAAPIGRHLAEVRGLSSRAIRHLERIEGNLVSERSARVDDLSVLVDLISASWKAVDDRLQQIEQALRDRENVVPVELIGELLGGDEQDTLPERHADAA